MTTITSHDSFTFPINGCLKAGAWGCPVWSLLMVLNAPSVGPLEEISNAVQIRKRGGAPRNPAPRNHFWGGLPNHEQIICKKTAFQSLAGCACETNRRVSTPLRSTSPFSEDRSASRSGQSLAYYGATKGKLDRFLSGGFWEC